MQQRTIQFIGIGGPASGSGFLYTYLHAHPETCVLEQATHFFSNHQRYHKGIAWYESQFVNCKPDMVRGECSADYIIHPEAADRIAHCYPQAKLLAVVCNPVERLYREYTRAIESGSVTRQVSLKRYIELHPESLTRGLFAKHLESYFAFYSPLQLYIAIHEDRYEDPVRYVQKVYEFLEIDDSFVPKPLRKFVKIDPDDPPPRPLWVRLLRMVWAPLRWLQLDKLVRLIYKHVRLYGRKVWPKMFTPKIGFTSELAEIKPPPQAPIDSELRDILHEYYAADVKKLSQFVRRNLNEEWGIQ